MGVGEAAALLNMSPQQVQRLCKISEEKPGEGLPFVWSKDYLNRTDVNNKPIRGRRLLFADAVRDLKMRKDLAERRLQVDPSDTLDT